MIYPIDREFNTLKVARNARIGVLQYFSCFCLLILIYKVGVRVFYPNLAFRHLQFVFILGGF